MLRPPFSIGSRAARRRALGSVLFCLSTAMPSCRSQPEPIAPSLRGASATASTALVTAMTEPPRQQIHEIQVGRSRIEVRLPRAGSAEQSKTLLAWIERCARAVAGYYGQFPVALLHVRVGSSSGEGIRGGQTLPTAPPTISIIVGERSSERHFEGNWSMTHEMVHLAFPNVPPAHHWIEEGLATYIEPIARARAGWITEESVWAEWIENMPLGLPQSGDGGLDGTGSWGRTYWGGALFCLLADIELRERSQGRYGLEDALRAIVAAGGNVSRRWPLERALRVGDEATGTTVLGEIYRAQGAQPVHTDLASLWRRLGVEVHGGSVRFIDSAPSARVRESIVAAKR
jgi:hypothetical protein